MNSIKRVFSGSVGFQLENRIAENSVKWENILKRAKYGIPCDERTIQNLISQPSFLEKISNPYFRNLTSYQTKIDENVMKSIPNEFKFLGLIYKNMKFDGKYHLTQSIFPIIYEEYINSKKERKEELEYIGTCLECITTGSLLFKYLENPTDLVSILKYIPSLKNKLKIGNMILAADYFYSVSAMNSTRLGSDINIRRLSEIDEIEGKLLFEHKNKQIESVQNILALETTKYQIAYEICEEMLNYPLKKSIDMDKKAFVDVIGLEFTKKDSHVDKNLMKKLYNYL